MSVDADGALGKKGSCSLRASPDLDEAFCELQRRQLLKLTL